MGCGATSARLVVPLNAAAPLPAADPSAFQMTFRPLAWLPWPDTSTKGDPER